MHQSYWGLKDIPDLSGKLILVTGGNSGLGYESVKAFAANGAEVIMASRSLSKAEAAKEKILKEAPGAKIMVMQLDLGDLASVRKFSQAFLEKYKRLNVLLNNAGIMMTPYFQTKDGFEGQFGTNHLGPFALTGQLLDVINGTPGARIVNVSSIAHRTADMNFDLLNQVDRKGYSPIHTYRRTKLANLLFTYELQRKFEAAGKETIAVAAHPGMALTNLGRHFQKRWYLKMLTPVASLILQDQEMGALPQVRASVDPAVKAGEYYGPNRKNETKGYPVLVQSTEASHNLEDAARLWKLSEELTRIRYAL